LGVGILPGKAGQMGDGTPKFLGEGFYFGEIFANIEARVQAQAPQ
jgi:hypothetical protein